MADNVDVLGIIGGVATKDLGPGGNGGPHAQKFIQIGPNGETLTGDALNGFGVDIKRVGVTVAVSGPATDAQMRATPLPVIDRGVASAVTSNFPATNTPAALVSALTNRRTLSIWNEGSTLMRIKYGSGPTSTSFKLKIQPQGYWEMPPGEYTGAVYAYWDLAVGGGAPTGSALITEG